MRGKGASKFQNLLAFLFVGTVITFPGVCLADDEKIPPLRPPHGDLVPSFWEVHGWQVALAVCAALVTLGLLVWWLTRPKRVAGARAEVVARRALEELRGRNEDAAVVAQVAAVLRHYVQLACELPPEELTTAELREALKGRTQITPELAAATIEFLSRCDVKKFAPAPPAWPSGVVAGACELMDKIEIYRHRTLQSAAGRAVTAPPAA